MTNVMRFLVREVLKSGNYQFRTIIVSLRPQFARKNTQKKRLRMILQRFGNSRTTKTFLSGVACIFIEFKCWA